MGAVARILGHGGIWMVARAARVSETTVRKGLDELEAGEGPLHPAIPAIANAVRDAVGISLRSMPFTPERVLALLRQKAEA